jgi:hypothetical protein
MRARTMLSTVIRGLANAQCVLVYVATQSAYCEFTPLPHDEYRIAVKSDRADVIARIHERFPDCSRTKSPR